MLCFQNNQDTFFTDNQNLYFLSPIRVNDLKIITKRIQIVFFMKNIFKLFFKHIYLFIILKSVYNQVLLIFNLPPNTFQNFSSYWTSTEITFFYPSHDSMSPISDLLFAISDFFLNSLKLNSPISSSELICDLRSTIRLRTLLASHLFINMSQMYTYIAHQTRIAEHVIHI